MSTPAAGWFPDPAGRPDGYRWWDGAAWTRYLTDDPTVPPPTGAPALSAAESAAATATEPTPTAPDDSGPPAEHAAATAVATVPRTRTRPMPPGYDFSRPTPAGGRGRRFGVLISSLVAVAIGVVVIAIAVTTHNEATAQLQPPPPLSSTAPARIAVDYEPDSRVVSIPGLQVTMPGSPFNTSESPTAGYGVFSDGVESEAVINKNYDGKGSSWVAVAAAGVYAEDKADKDARSTAEAVFQSLTTTGYDGLKISTKKMTSQAAVGHADKAWIVTGEIHYKKKAVASTYDNVSVLVIDAGDGRYIGWIGSRPNKTKPEVKTAMTASIKSIAIR